MGPNATTTATQRTSAQTVNLRNVVTSYVNTRDDTDIITLLTWDETAKKT